MTRALTFALATLAAIVLTAPLHAADESKPDEKKTEDSASRARSAESRAALFDKLDANHDGQITSDEVPEESRRLFERLLRRGDKNGDGKLTRERIHGRDGRWTGWSRRSSG